MKIKNENGSITIFVLVGLLFMSAFLMLSYGYNVNKSKIAKEQFNMISEIYMPNSNIIESYTEAYTDLRKKNKQTLTYNSADEGLTSFKEVELTKTYSEKISNYKIYGNPSGLGDENIFPINNSNFYSIDSSNVIIQQDGWININYNNASRSEVKYINFWPSKVHELLKNTMYTAILETQELNGINRLVLSSIRSNTTDTKLPQFDTNCEIQNMTSNSIYFIQMTSSSNFTDPGYLMRTFISIPENINANAKIRISLIKGEIKSDDFAGYELPGKIRIPIRITDKDNNSQIYNIYVNEPLDSNDYIDYKSRKVIRNNGTQESVELPELQTYEDYTKIEVLTGTAPSKIEVEYTGYTI